MISQLFMPNDILPSLKWNERKKIHNNLRRQAVLSIINTCTYPSFTFPLFKFTCTSNRSFCVFTMHFTGSSVPYKVRGSGSFNHFTFSLKNYVNTNADFLISKQFYKTISIMHQPFSLNKEATGLFYCSSGIHLRIANSSLKRFRRVFHFRKISQGTSMAGFF